MQFHSGITGGGGCVDASPQPCLSSRALQDSQAVGVQFKPGAAEFFQSLDLSRNDLGVPGTDTSGSC